MIIAVTAEDDYVWEDAVYITRVGILGVLGAETAVDNRFGKGRC